MQFDAYRKDNTSNASVFEVLSSHEDGQVNFGIGTGIRNKEFGGANGIMITTEGNMASSSGIMMQEYYDQGAGGVRGGANKYQSITQR